MTMPQHTEVAPQGRESDPEPAKETASTGDQDQNNVETVDPKNMMVDPSGERGYGSPTL
jgi:hypothetical protein